MDSPKTPLPGRPSAIVAGGEIGEMVDQLARISISTSESEDEAVGLGRDSVDRCNDLERKAMMNRLWLRIVGTCISHLIISSTTHSFTCWTCS
jgi:hypothetical protein